MLRYIIKRIVAVIPVVSVVALFVFSLLYFSPGDPAAMLAGDNASAEDIDRIRESIGLNQEFFVQFGHWALNVLQGDFGRSLFSNTPVSALILERMGPTLALAWVTMAIAIPIGIPLGVVAAWRYGTWIDRLVSFMAVAGFSVPVFVFAYCLIYLLSIHLAWFPVQGYVEPSAGLWPFLRHLILPGVTLSLLYVAMIARMTRTTMLETLKQDYIRTARSKGLRESRVVMKHALRNASVPIVTTVGLGVALVITGVVVTESVFAIPGLGRLTVDAILRRDYPVIQGMILVFSLTYMLINLLIDISYTFLDPRIRY
ncbi:ABC transporter permease [Microvirga pudoricolor]|uniref:ABC transporter permease n=1 Tax=Microvirga pudoricolor TaxID=2778729 RepID=UPI0019524231|nr:ABC transporter permease [Microvirga pudoricolor]MBM6595541.1 ABC transporter permease [Microvirga pudoricolor]